MASLIFDYDGTLHESLHIYAPAFRLSYEQLVKKGLALQREWSAHEISRWLGFSAKDMWSQFMPALTEQEKAFCSKVVGDEMVRLTLAGNAKLYPQALTVLQRLKAAGHNLIFLSNCKHSYMQAHREYWGLDQYFSAFYCTEDFAFAPKWQIFDLINLNCSGNWVVIGDRWQDMEIAARHSLISIGCTYGYGSLEELSRATIQVSSVEGILTAVSECLAKTN
ncbi:HAD family hydrolase [Faecalispora anaeroviscerum]|uniref:HAD family hydrolase n=1 Tax=Faecalispora anaeroviscerum TaxID=2991836 RepID=UPI0024B914C4|nr:HAD hydrolase-like protein [Faecalispora anaeroviscerum]